MLRVAGPFTPHGCLFVPGLLGQPVLSVHADLCYLLFKFKTFFLSLTEHSISSLSQPWPPHRSLASVQRITQLAGLRRVWMWGHATTTAYTLLWCLIARLRNPLLYEAVLKGNCEGCIGRQGAEFIFFSGKWCEFTTGQNLGSEKLTGLCCDSRMPLWEKHFSYSAMFSAKKER